MYLIVVDRVRRSTRLIEYLALSLKSGGMLLLSRRFHFEDRWAPPELWVEDLRDLLGGETWDIGQIRTAALS